MNFLRLEKKFYDWFCQPAYFKIYLAIAVIIEITLEPEVLEIMYIQNKREKSSSEQENKK